ncbi:MarR family winged helix-turn-helix transcriptional regulator [Altericroceibacterium xinjiangense]|uniref:MarR family winged helix-turn-helix transcriptional regulator n=1 Tax=Altericroceibacterium xinjiangense TaxID=762261 RepID=UPI000F7E648F|nr:MarR family transcriptional regulator [Altericroceibacterium xinjiangense]
MSDTENLVAAYAELYLRFVRVMDRRMAAEGASLARTRLLLFLQRKGPMRATAIAEFFDQSPRTVTEAIDTLERDGLVRRKPDPSDRRAKLVSVTPAGLEAVRKTEPLRSQMVERTFGVLNAEEKAWLAEILERLSATLPGSGEGPEG